MKYTFFAKVLKLGAFIVHTYVYNENKVFLRKGVNSLFIKNLMEFHNLLNASVC